ncbi:DegT/DnrJ/EryC1/StrS family aminotransferase [Candidatus Pacearchaeota archaeon]|nr:DegT/DnrJ/EryC1/StrS family aminotransferase [Candidatus Pacearchaeota archaeon]
MIERFDKQEIEAVVNSIKNASFLSGYTNKYLGGEEIQKFEEEFAKYHNCKYGIAVNSGTTALFVAQKAAGVSPKHKVVVPCITFTATTSQVLACNAKPLFADIDKSSYCMNYDFSNKSIKYAIPVHLLGHPCKYEMIKEMRNEKIFVIEDCAQAMGASYMGKMVGSMGDCGIFSFQETKHITTLGEGGMIITNNEEFTEKCRKIRNHGEYYKDDLSVGYNFRMTEAQAAFGRVQLRKLNKILNNFRSNANYIFRKLPESIDPPKIPKKIKHSFLILGCKFNEKVANVDRTTFVNKLTENRKRILANETKSDIKGINFRPGKIIGVGYRSVQYEIPLYKKYAPKEKCINGEDFVRNSLFIDIHRWRSREEINEELQILHDTVKQFNK